MRNIFRNLAALYFIPRSSTLLVYMLQSVEYQPREFLQWFWTAKDFSRVIRRRSLDMTKYARVLRLVAALGMLVQFVFGVLLMVAASTSDVTGALWFGLALMVSYPVVWAHGIALVALLGQSLLIKRREKKQYLQAKELFSKHPGVRIAIAGSYGKTSMKELLATVLSEGKKVAATPGNMNVISSHAKFARSLSGEEDVVLVEFGEGKPGDVMRFASMFVPSRAIITGIAPAHLDKYKTLDAAARDIFSVSEQVASQYVYVNTESTFTGEYMQPDFRGYDSKGALGWTISDAKTSLQGTSFTLMRGNNTIKLKSGLIGEHQLGPLAFAAGLAMDMGLTEKQVCEGIAKTVPFEHRMQPYQIGGAWVIDDTYNGNLEGIRVGTELLKTLKAKRKLYVTPGLVDQGDETATIHQAIGELVAAAKPDVVVLMRNSVTEYIESGLKSGGFSGQTIIQDDPLTFYLHLSDFLATGDVMLMQNDWTDNYR